MDSQNRIYRPLEHYELEDVKVILKSGTLDELALLPLGVGQNLDDWKAAQRICVSLFTHDDARIRANAAMGLSYIARTKRKLDKGIVKPYLLKELRENSEFRRSIIDSITDINQYMGWNLAKKLLEKFKE